jgi:hypothetical protein
MRPYGLTGYVEPSVHQVGFNLNLYKMHGEYNIKYSGRLLWITYGNEHSDSIKGRRFLKQLCNLQLLREDSVS